LRYEGIINVELLKIQTNPFKAGLLWMSLQTELGIEITTSINMPYFGSEIL